MSKTLRLMSNARIELGRLGERDDVIQAYIDALRSLAQIEDQTVEEKLSILRPLLYGNKLKDPDIEEGKVIPMFEDCQPRRTAGNSLYCITHSTVVQDVWATYSKDVREGLTAGELPPAGTLCTVAQHEIDLEKLRDETEPIRVIPREPFCDCCGPGYRPGDEGCNHTLTKMSSESEFTPDFIFIGNECFAMGDRSSISYKGEQYYRTCNHFVADRVDGGVEFCVKRVGHPGSDHESYSGIILHTIKENI